MTALKTVVYVSHMLTALLQHHFIVHALEIGQMLVLVRVILLLHGYTLLSAHSTAIWLLHLHDLTLSTVERAMCVLHGDALAVGGGARLMLLALGPRIVYV